jgi:MFS family permease
VLPGLIWALTETKPDQRPASVESAGRPVADDQGMPWSRLSVSYVTAFLGMTLFYLIPVQIPFHLQHLLGLSGVHIGIAMGAMSAAAACAAPFYGRLRTKWSFQSVFAVLFGAMALGYFGLFLVRDFWLVLLSLAVFGVGMGVMLPNLNVWVASVAPAQYRGRAMSGLAASYYFGQFVCPMLSQPVADQVGLPNTFGLGAILLTIISLSFLFQSLRLSKAGE